MDGQNGSVQIDPSSVKPIGGGPSGPSSGAPSGMSSGMSSVQIDPSSIQKLPGVSMPSAPQQQQQNSQSGGDPSLQVNSGDNFATTAAKETNAVGAGIGSALLDSVNGGLDLVNKGAQKVTGAKNLIPHQLLEDRAAELKRANAGNPLANAVGYGGETLMEFILGDAAIKALPMAQRLMAAAKTMKALETSPSIIKALKLGASIMSEAGINGTEAGIVQGAQTFDRTGGDIKTAAEDAGKTALTGTVLSGITGSAGRIASGLGDVANTTERLSKAVGSVDTKPEVAKAIKSKIDTAKNELHSGYEAGVQDLTKRLKNSEIDPQDNPLAEKAQQLLNEPEPAEHPTVALAKRVSGDNLDKSVKTLLEAIAKGEVPGKSEVAAKSSGLLDQFGKVIDNGQPTPKSVPPFKIDNLLSLRRQILSTADNYEYKDINSRVLRSLVNGFGNEMSPMDKTIDKLAQASGDTTAVSDFRNLRANYRDKINLFDEPVIQSLRDGKMDDAAKNFVGVSKDGSALPTAGKIRFNTNVLRGIIGDDGVKEFGKQVFGTMLSDSVENGRFNPAKFVQTWKRVGNETKGDLFDMNNAKNGLRLLERDAQSAAALQHLTRVGVLTASGAALGAAGPISTPLGMGVGSILGLTVAEGGGLAKGRELLNYVANHPAVWKTYQKVAEGAEGNVGRLAGQVVRGTASQAVATDRTKIKNVYDGLSDSLAH